MPRNTTALDIKGGKKQTIAFGLVNVPVRIKNVDASRKDSGAVSGNFICGEHKAKAKQVYVCELDGKTHNAGDQIEKVKGYPVEGGYVVLDEDVIEQIMAEKTGAIAIDQFVPADKIDPFFYKTSYIVAPDEGGGPTYDLLAKAMAETGTVAVGKAVLPATKKTQLVTIRWSPFAEQLILATCKFDAEINWSDLDAVANGIKARPAPADANVEMARQIIDGLAGDFDPTQVEDEYAKALRDLIEQAAKGKKLTAPTPKAAPAAGGDDLVAQLQKSIAASKKTGKKPAKAKAAA